MKKFIFSFILIFSPFVFLRGQGNMEGGLYAEYFQLGDRGFQDFGGIFHYPFKDRFTLNYQIGFGTSINGGFFFHAPGGVVAGIFLLDQIPILSYGNIGYLTALLCVVPEGVGYYLPTKGKIATHLSVNPLSVEYFYKSEPHEEWGKLSCSVVARFKMQTNLKIPTYISPQIAGTMIYSPGHSTARYGIRAGVTIGFEKKDK